MTFVTLTEHIVQPAGCCGRLIAKQVNCNENEVVFFAAINNSQGRKWKNWRTSVFSRRGNVARGQKTLDKSQFVIGPLSGP